MGRYVLGIDAGTESVRAGIYDEKGKCISAVTSDNVNIHRNPGWCEQDISKWETSIIEAIKIALSKSPIKADQIEGIGIDGTSCTVVQS